jgi:hypothetical protein
VKALILRNLSFLFDVDEEMEKKEYEGTIPEALLLMNGSLAHNAVSAIPGAALSKVLAMQGGDAKKIEELYLRTLSRKPTPGEIKRWTDFVNAPRFVVETEPPQEATPLRRANRQQMPSQPMRRALGNQDPLSRLAQRFKMPDPTPEQQAYEDLFWALLNSSEFLFNH